MTIEIAPKAPAAHKAGGTEGPVPKSKPQSGTKTEHAATAATDKADGKAGAEATKNAGKSGFRAILSALGDGTAPNAVDGAGIAPGVAGMDAATPMDDPLTEGKNKGVADQAAVLVQVTPAAPLPADAASAAKPDADPAKNALAAALASTSANKPAGFVDAAPGAPEQDGATRSLQRGTGNGHGKTEKNAWVANTEPATSAAPADAAKTEAQPSFDFKMFSAMQEARGVQAQKPPQAPVVTSLAGPEKATGERAESVKTSSDPTYSAAPVGVSPGGFSANGTTGAAPMPDLQVAEQVKYWISQDVQNAELKLDGLGDKPVEVSIFLSGNEAHIAFRTDELQTRGVLESAGAHLKDMLAREGLVLSGVSVGTSGTDDGTGGERRPRQGARQGVVSVVPVGVADVGARSRQPSGRSLDLFV